MLGTLKSEAWLPGFRSSATLYLLEVNIVDEL